MRRVEELEQTGVLAVGQTISVLLSQSIPVFVKIDRERQAIYRHHHRVLVHEEPISTASSDPPPRVPARNLGRISYRSARGYRLRSKKPKFKGAVSKLPRRLQRTPARQLPAATQRRPLLTGATRKVQFECGFKGYEDDVLYLRVDDRVLAEIDLTGTCKRSIFKDGGYSHPRPFEIVGQTRGGYSIKKTSNYVEAKLEDVSFDHAFVVDKQGLEQAAAGRSLLGAPAPEEFRVNFTLEAGDLWLLSSDFEQIERQASQNIELVAYPFEHKDKMPGLYWMFQAAYAHNRLGTVAKANRGVRRWLLEHAPKKTYRHGSIRTAEKFVWPEVDRKQGAGGRGEFALEDLDEWTVAENYELNYISKGFSVVLAVADWWLKVLNREPGKSTMHLADKLVENKFAGLEVGDLVYLISGSQITAEIKESLESGGQRQRVLRAKKASTSSNSF